MKLKPNLILFTVLLLFLFTGLKAQTTSPAFTTSHLQAAEKYLIATGINTQFAGIINNMINSSSAQIAENHRASYVKVMQAFMGKYYAWDVLKNEYTKIYAGEFTEDELKQLTAFYSSPIGKKASAKTPLLLQKGMTIGQQVMANHRPELEQMMKEAFAADSASTPKNN
ncbi:MAG: DUF2059 domain-containing protein [Mucilaginibacter sp.]|uniref:DUF2059 domain-containing protein n=1 Tax=Mucilaginibacter sp. TaxID=1882438 RepID=UPI0031AA9A6B